MIDILSSDKRGHYNYGWLDTRHSFSFGEYQNPAYVNYRSLRVINEDVISPGKGFDTHSHQDMEILTWMIEGQLRHKDSKGHEDVISPGSLQYMRAGTGIRHSEHNASAENQAHLLQIWLTPAKLGLEPSYTKADFQSRLNREGLSLLASGYNPQPGIIHLDQKAELYYGRLTYPNPFKMPVDTKHGVWIQMISGSLDCNDELVRSGDGVCVDDESEIALWPVSDEASLLLFLLE